MGEVIKINNEDNGMKSLRDEFQEDMVKTVVETVLPIIKPMIKPATKKFTEFMQKGNMIVVKVVGGNVHFFQILEKDIEAFKLKEGSQPVATYDLEGFIGKVLSGDFDF